MNLLNYTLIIATLAAIGIGLFVLKFGLKHPASVLALATFALAASGIATGATRCGIGMFDFNEAGIRYSWIIGITAAVVVFICSRPMMFLAFWAVLYSFWTTLICVIPMMICSVFLDGNNQEAIKSLGKVFAVVELVGIPVAIALAIIFRKEARAVVIGGIGGILVGSNIGFLLFILAIDLICQGINLGGDLVVLYITGGWFLAGFLGAMAGIFYQYKKVLPSETAGEKA